MQPLEPTTALRYATAWDAFDQGQDDSRAEIERQDPRTLPTCAKLMFLSSDG